MAVKEERVHASRWRGVVSVAVLAIGLLLVPLAAIGSWTRAELVDTDRFVHTLGPLVDEPEVQQFIADQAVAAVENNIDIPALVHDAFSVLKGIDLPGQATVALALLETATTNAISNLVSTTADRLVSSPQFSSIWHAILRQSHAHTIALLSTEVNGPVTVTDEKMIAIDLAPIISQIRSDLVAQGIPMASHIPDVDRVIPLVDGTNILLARSVYRTVDAVGFWMPWIALALLAAGIALAPRRARALAWTAGISTVVMALIAIGISMGKTLFIDAVSPDVMSRTAATAIIDQVLSLLVSVITSLILLLVIVWVAAFFSGETRFARAVRGVVQDGFARSRAGLAAHGFSPRFGARIERTRPLLIGVIVGLSVFAVLAIRPVTVASVCIVLALMLLLLAAVELLRRPEPAEPAEDQLSEAALTESMSKD